MKQEGLVKIKAKYPGKCTTCGTTINKDDEIYKVDGSNDWCKNVESCPLFGNLKKETQRSTKMSNENAPEWQKTHDEIWAFALESAKAACMNAGSDPKQEMILAQVFYKKCMDAKIHGPHS